MLNKSGITKTTLAAPRQILANVEMQSSVGCIVGSALGVTVGSRKIAKAGTPIMIDLMDRNGTPAVAGDGTNAMNAVLLHDVDVTDGNANGTALVFGFVNVNRVDTDVAIKITAAVANTDASKLLVFMKA